MKFGTHVLSEVLNQIILFFLAQRTKKAFCRDFQNAENLTYGSGTAPAYPFRRGPQYFYFFNEKKVFAKIPNRIIFSAKINLRCKHPLSGGTGKFFNEHKKIRSLGR